jgi:hypothetical protein
MKKNTSLYLIKSFLYVNGHLSCFRSLKNIKFRNIFLLALDFINIFLNFLDKFKIVYRLICSPVVSSEKHSILYLQFFCPAIPLSPRIHG